MSKKVLAPSLLSVDFGKLDEVMSKLDDTKAEWLHIDVMDGHFVPNLTFGAKIIQTLRLKSKLFFDVHMMVQNPSKLLEQLVTSGADQITVHYEACDHLHTTLNKIKALGIKAGIAISPNTDIEKIKEFISEVDHVLVMSVEPGFGGQTMLPNAIDRISNIVKYREESGLNFTIGVDGGINADNLQSIAGLGADVMVVGTGIFKTGQFDKNIDIYYDIINKI